MCRDRPCSDEENPMVSIVYPEDLTGCTEFGWDGYTFYQNCTHALGGDFTIDNLEPDLSYGAFEINVKDLNNEACTKLATYDWKFEKFKGISLGAKNTPNAFYGLCENFDSLDGEHNPDDGDTILRCANSVPLSPSVVSRICSQCNATGGCSITIAYYH